MKTPAKKWRLFFLLTLGLAMLLISGCASAPRPARLNPPINDCLAACQRLQVAPTHYILAVDISRQQVLLYEQGGLVKIFPCSTSRFGIGEALHSDGTPLGLHRIAEKIGDGEPAGTIFKDREVIGHVSQLGVKAGYITTRILWLEGLEPGYNQGGDVDSHDRMIYIHGTGNQHSIGRPVTYGCIHMADKDLIWLFNLLPSGTLVWLAE